MLAGILAGQPWESVLTGDASLSRRPMGRIAEPLRAMGAEVETIGERGRPPIRIRGRVPLKAVSWRSEVASAQVKSCVLLAALYAEGTTEYTEPAVSRDHTERFFEYFGLPIERRGTTTIVAGRNRPAAGVPARPIRVPGDPSSAAFFIVAAAAMPGSDLRIPGLMLNPTRTRFLKVLERMGARVEIETSETTPGPEPMGSVRVRGGELGPFEVAGEEVPLVIDEAPILAVAAAAADGTSRFLDARELRVKESDRITGTVSMLRSFGIEAEEMEDGFEVRGGSPVRAAEFDCRGDHRLAMAAAILALRAEGVSRILGAEWIRTSFPRFEEFLRGKVQFR